MFITFFFLKVFCMATLSSILKTTEPKKLSNYVCNINLKYPIKIVVMKTVHVLFCFVFETKV